MNEKIFRVDFKGILNILSKHLYSSEEIFIRELLQNSTDAISLRKSELTSNIEGTINVELIDSKDRKVIVFEDNGVGLTLEEVEIFLSVIGSSSKKGIINLNQADNSFIGQFGIGLLSCFMVSNKITLISKSQKSDHAVKWEASIDGTYKSSTLESNNLETGTKIFLELNKEKSQKYTLDVLKDLLTKYSQFLPLVVNLINQNGIAPITRRQFPWAKGENLTSEEVIEFGRNYFNIQFNHYIPLASQDGQSIGFGFIFPFPSEIGSTQANHIYIKNMLIDEKADSILPEWAFFIKAIVNSEVLKPTASREGIYKENTLERTRNDFEISIRNYFKQIAKTAPSILEEIVNTHSLAIKAFAVTDNEFFDLIIDHVVFNSSNGDIKAKDIQKFDNAKYVENIDQFRQLLPIAKANNQLLINGGYIYNSTLLKKLSQKHQYNLSLLDDIKFENLLDEVTWEEGNMMNSFLQKATNVLSEFNCTPQLKRFNPYSLPAIFQSNRNHDFSREINRTKSQTSELWSGMLSEFLQEGSLNQNSNLHLNIDNPLVKKIMTIDDQKLFVKSLELIYLNSLLIGHYSLNNNEAEKLNENLLTIIDQAIKI
jgi:molecular chaperone HtpG